MSEIVGYFTSPAWWFSTVIVAFAVNMGSGLLLKKMESSNITLPGNINLTTILILHASLTCVSGLVTLVLHVQEYEGSNLLRWGWSALILVATAFTAWQLYDLQRKKARAIATLLMSALSFAFFFWHYPTAIQLFPCYFMAALLGAAVGTAGERLRARSEATHNAGG